MKTIEERREQFQLETCLLLHMMWEDSYLYLESDMDKVNNAIINDYFDDERVKDHLTVVNGVAHNKQGLDVRDVARNFIAHFKRQFKIKPHVAPIEKLYVTQEHGGVYKVKDKTLLYAPLDGKGNIMPDELFAEVQESPCLSYETHVSIVIDSLKCTRAEAMNVVKNVHYY